jgi:hypothetical protein
LKALWAYLKKRDLDVNDIMERIKDLIVKTIIRFVRFNYHLSTKSARQKCEVYRSNYSKQYKTGCRLPCILKTVAVFSRKRDEGAIY